MGARSCCIDKITEKKSILKDPAGPKVFYTVKFTQKWPPCSVMSCGRDRNYSFGFNFNVIKWLKMLSNAISEMESIRREAVSLAMSSYVHKMEPPCV